MKALMNIAKIAVVLAVAFYCSGCLSVWSQQASMNEIRRERIMASGDTNAIKALEMGVAPATAIKAVRVGEGAGIGIDVTNLEALKRHPVRQILAALGDAALIYATKEGIDGLNDGGGGTSRGDGNAEVNVGGDGNSVTVTISGDSTSSSSTDNDDSNNTY